MTNVNKHTVSRVPEVTLVFRIIKIAATTLGAMAPQQRDTQ
jgi:uncharacterized membrane-anchored protein